MNFETTIGLEVHVELKTNSKIFSPSPVNFGAAANENTNMLDWGYPGVLPTLNKGVVKAGIMAGLALHAEINPNMHFDRKNYFYPDNPKAYQITQSETPIAHDGWVEIEVDGKKKKIGIAEMHIEEDAGKNTHTGQYSYVDLNRQGTPLIEIVSKPDIASPDEAVAYLEALRQRIQFTGISDVKMEEGSMRVDTNISVRPYGAKEFGTKTEMKNINSFNYVRNALNVSDDWIAEITAEMPQMPGERRAHYVNDLGLTDYDAMVLTQTKEMSDFFEATVAEGADARKVANYLMNDVNSYLNTEHVDLPQTKLTPANLAGMIKLIDDGTISSKMAKKVFQGILQGEEPAEFAKKNGLVQLSDPAQLQPIVDEILANNPQSIEDFKNGKDRAVGFLVGQIMKQTKGTANPGVVNKLLMQALNAQ